MKKIGKGFALLTSEVIYNGLCSSCGSCMTVCPVKAIAIDKDIPDLKGICREDCDLCLSVCPQYIKNLNTLASYCKQHRLRSADSFIGRATDPEILKKVGSGGICSAVFSSMLREGMIEAVAVTQFGGEWPWIPCPQLTDDPEEVIRSGCPKYALSSNVNLLWDIARSGFKRVAFVGLPCQVEAIALIKMNADHIAPELIEAVMAIVCTVGIWCGNNFREIGTRKFIEKMNVDPELVTEVGYGINKGGLCFYADHNSGRAYAPFGKYLGFLLSDYVAPACRKCNRRFSHYADLSIGGLQQPGLKWSSISVQTHRGLDLLLKAVERDYIEILPSNDSRTTEIIQGK